MQINLSSVLGAILLVRASSIQHASSHCQFKWRDNPSGLLLPTRISPVHPSRLSGGYFSGTRCVGMSEES